MLPSTATPSAAPSSRVASFIADPAPARRGGTADMIAAVMGDIVSAIPETRKIRQNSTYGYDVPTSIRENDRNPNATNAIPVPTVLFEPMRATIRGVIGDTMIMIGAMGRKRTAVPSAL